MPVLNLAEAEDLVAGALRRSRTSDANAASVAHSVPAELRNSAASMWLCASSKGSCGVSMPR